VLGARGDPAALKRIFDRSPVPLVMSDDGRRYVDVNAPARLAFRLSLAEMRSYRLDDLTPRPRLQNLVAAWTRLLENGCVAGRGEIAGRDGSRLPVVYVGVANVLPGRHVIAFEPAGWPEGELDVFGQGQMEAPTATLTGREREVLQLAAEGLSAPAIGRRLVLSPATVRTHLRHIYEKLDVGDRAAAVAKGIRLGLIG
jgi:DNA-binding CsgD family transcriptional regulator